MGCYIQNGNYEDHQILGKYEEKERGGGIKILKSSKWGAGGNQTETRSVRFNIFNRAKKGQAREHFMLIKQQQQIPRSGADVAKQFFMQRIIIIMT